MKFFLLIYELFRFFVVKVEFDLFSKVFVKYDVLVLVNGGI